MVDIIDLLLLWLKIDNSALLIPSHNLRNTCKLILFDLTGQQYWLQIPQMCIFSTREAQNSCAHRWHKTLVKLFTEAPPILLTSQISTTFLPSQKIFLNIFMC